MNESMAMEYAGRIVNSTTGWTPEATVELTKELMGWHNLICAERAVDAVVHGWVERSRPPLGWIVRAYNNEMDEVRRKASAAAPRYDQEIYPTFAEGRKIAAKAYEAECKRQGREPNWDMFDSLIGGAGRGPS